MTLRTVLSLLVVALLATQVAAQEHPIWNNRVAHTIDDYVPIDHLAGTLRVFGSDHMKSLSEELKQEFQAIYPLVQIQIEAKGSATAMPALTSGVADLGSMIREPSPVEKGAFVAAHRYKPSVLAIAIEPTPENSHARFLYLVVNHKPGLRLDPLRYEFVKFVYSMQGQECVAKTGFVPLTRELCERQLATVLIN